MAFIPAQFCAKLVPRFEYPNGNIAVNTLTFSHFEEIFASDLELLTDAYLAWWDDTAAALVSSSVKLLDITATDLTTASGLQHVHTIAGGSAGGGSAAVMPANVTLCTTFKTAFSGRSFRCRAYWIGLHEGQIVGDFVDATPAENIRAAWDTLSGNTGEAGWGHVVISYETGGAPRVTGLATTVAAYSLFDRRVDTQRRRLT